MDWQDLELAPWKQLRMMSCILEVAEEHMEKGIRAHGGGTVKIRPRHPAPRSKAGG